MSLLLSCAIGSVQAQSSADSPSDSAPQSSSDELVGELTVTAEFFRPIESTSGTKFNAPLFETPQSVAVISEDLIDRFQVDELRQITSYVAGLNEQTDLFAEGGGLVSRGFPLDTRYGYKINDISAFKTFPLDPIVIDRVEFVKGPTGVIFGRNSYGGVLNVISKRPTRDARSTASLSLGSYGYTRVEADVSVPIVDDTFAMRLPVAWEESNNLTGNAPRDLFAAAPSLFFQVGDNTTLDVIGIFEQWNENYGIGFGSYAPESTEPGFSCATTRCVPPPERLRDFHTGLNWNDSDVEGTEVLATLKHTFASELSSVVSVGYYDTTSIFDQTFLYGTFDADGEGFMYGDRVNFSEEGYSAEAGLTGDFQLFGRANTFYIGADWTKSEQYNERTDDPFLGNVNVFDPRGALTGTDRFRVALFQMPNWVVDAIETDDREYYGIGAQALLRPFERLSVLIGGRWEKSDLLVVRTPTNAQSGDPGLGGRVNELLNDQSPDKFIPRFGLTWSIVPETLNTYASYAEGYQPQVRRTRSGEFLDPEEGAQIEVGLKAQLLNRRLGITLAAYEIERKNVGVADPSNTPEEDFSIPGLTQTHRGVELEIVGEVAQGFSVIVQASHLDAEAESLVGERLPTGEIVNLGTTRFIPAAVPESTAGAFALYEFTNGPLAGFFLGGGISYVGEQEVNISNSYKLPAYQTVNLNMGYRPTSSWELRLGVTNLFDEKYFTTFGSSNYGVRFGDERRVVGSLKYSFD